MKVTEVLVEPSLIDLREPPKARTDQSFLADLARCLKTVSLRSYAFGR